MLVNKVTTGFVVQVFDTELKRFVSQEFMAGEQTDYEDRLGDPVDRAIFEVDGQEAYLPFDTVQPKSEAQGQDTSEEYSMRLNIEIDGAAVEGDATAKMASILRKFANALETYTATSLQGVAAVGRRRRRCGHGGGRRTGAPRPDRPDQIEF